MNADKKIKFGSSIWPWRWEPPYEATLSRIAKAGFKAVELIAWNREALDTYYTPQKIRELRDTLAGEGLELSEFVSTPHGMSSPDKKARDAAVDHFKRLCEVGIELGTTMVNSVSSYPLDVDFPWITERPHMQTFHVDLPSGANWNQNYEDYVDSVRRCCDIAEQARLRWAIEAHPFRYVANAQGMLRLLEHVKSPVLGMNFDPSHLFPCGEIPEVVIYELGDRIFHCHFSDNDAMTNAHWRPGKGKIDWQSVMTALKEVGFKGVISIELEDVAGVSRGGRQVPGVAKFRPDAGPELEAESVAGMNYIKDICKKLDIPYVG
jgi:sugar phosphate isomerase/epimerase